MCNVQRSSGGFLSQACCKPDQHYKHHKFVHGLTRLVALRSSCFSRGVRLESVLSMKKVQ